MTVRTRIAPSPTGYPHIGTIFQALINFIYARQHHGQFIVRIEDTDRSRFVPDAEEKLFQALEWFGLTPDESPRHGGPYGPYRQSERLPIYHQYLNQLLDAGHAYYCFCSKERLASVRQEMQKQGKPPMYDQHCRQLDPQEAHARAQKESHVVRLKVPANQKIIVHDVIRGQIEFDSQTVDDQVLLKSDGYPTYHLAVVIDDHLMKITHVVRGEEWLSSAPKHVLLYSYFGWGMPQFIHTPTLRNPDKSKLSKRHGHASVSWYLENGYLQEAIINFLLTRVWNHPSGQEIFNLKEAISAFDFSSMHIQGPIVDLDKLNWYNGVYIRQLTPQQLLAKLQTGGFIPSDCPLPLAQKILPLIQERLVKLSEFENLTAFFYRDIAYDPQLLLKKKASRQLVTQQLEETITQLTQLDHQNWIHEKIEKKIRTLSQTNNWKPSQYFMMLRIASTGRQATPPLFETMAVLGRNQTLSRLQSALTQLITRH